MMISLQRDQNSDKNTSSKQLWYEGDFYPVVGTSVFLEIDTTINTASVVGLQTHQFVLQRKYFGPSGRIDAADVENPLIGLKDQIPF